MSGTDLINILIIIFFVVIPQTFVILISVWLFKWGRKLGNSVIKIIILYCLLILPIVLIVQQIKLSLKKNQNINKYPVILIGAGRPQRLPAVVEKMPDT